MKLSHNEERRGFRTIFHGIIVLALLGLAWFLSSGQDISDGQREIIRWALGIIALAELGYQFENALRSFNLTLPGGASIEAQGESGPQQ